MGRASHEGRSNGFKAKTRNKSSSCSKGNSISSVQSLSRVRLFMTLWTAGRQASLSITNSRSLLKLMATESVMPSNHLIPCRPLLLLPSIFPSIRVFSSESVLCIKWPKYWSFSISPSNEYSGLIFFKIHWLDLLVVQGTLKSLLQHYSSKASILWHSAFFVLQLSHPYMMGKTMKLHMSPYCLGWPFSATKSIFRQPGCTMPKLFHVSHLSLHKDSNINNKIHRSKEEL